MNDPTVALPRRYWREVVQLPPARAGRPTTGLLVAHYAAMAQAHLAAYDDAIIDSGSAVGVRAAVADHFDAAVAAFTAAAALSGWDGDKIMDAIDDGSTMHEAVWQWIDDWNVAPGMTDALVASLAPAPVVPA